MTLNSRPMVFQLANPNDLVCPFCFNQTVFQIVNQQIGAYERFSIGCQHCNGAGPASISPDSAIDCYRDHYRYSIDHLLAFCGARSLEVKIRYSLGRAAIEIFLPGVTIGANGLPRSAAWDCWEKLGAYYAQMGDPVTLAAQQDADEAKRRQEEEQ